MRSLPFTVDRVAMRVAAKHADDIRNGLRSSINISQIVDSFLATYPDGVVTRAQARDWARLNVVTNNVRLGRALEALYASGWVLGTDYGSEAMRLAAIKKAPTFTIDWSKWKPGQPAAEALVRPPRGLRRLLAKFRNQTIKGISDTNLDRIGTVLADGLAVGADSRSVARELMELGIRGIVDDARRALTIAITETSRAVGAATLERYQEMGLRRFEWITVEGEGVCEACDENAEAGPIPVGEEFPSGDLHEPAHPNCRCKMAPFIEGFSTPVREMAELGAIADAVKYDDEQARDENGRWTSTGDAGVGSNNVPGKLEQTIEQIAQRVLAAQPYETNDPIKTAEMFTRPSSIYEKVIRERLVARYMEEGLGRNLAIAQTNADFLRLSLYQGNIERAAQETDSKELDKDDTEFINRYNENVQIAQENTENLVNNGKVTIAMTGDNLAQVFEQGAFQNQFQSKDSGGKYDLGLRRIAESAAQGIEIDTAPSDRPIYGYLTDNNDPVTGSRETAAGWRDIGSTENSFVNQYGDVRVVLNDSVRENTTYSVGDSLRTGVISQPLAGGYRSDSWVQSGGLQFGSPYHKGGELAADYVEAQVHNGVRVSDIAEIYVPSNLYDSVSRMVADSGQNITVNVRR